MLPPVSDAIQRFRGRLRLAAFVRGLLLGFFVLAVGIAGVLLAERFVATDGVGLQALSAALASVPDWAWWGGAAGGALLVGTWTMRRHEIGDAVVVAHMEKRLSTNGLLLAASQGVELDASFARQLQQQLQRTESVLPTIRWQALCMRPLVAALLLIVVQTLPAVVSEQPATEALAVATQRLVDELQLLDEREAVPDERVAELRRAVTDLHERAKAGESGLWREIDQLRERIDREQKLADSLAGELAKGGGGGRERATPADDSANPGSSGANQGSRPAPTTEQLAEAMAKLAALDPEALDGLADRLPPELGDAERQAVAEAVRGDGSVDAAALPEDEAARRALADAVADIAGELAEDTSKLADLAAGAPDMNQQDLAEQLSSLAEQFEQSAQDLANSLAGSEQSEGGKQPGEGQPDAPALSAELAKAALEMAKAGALEDLPDGLKDAMRKAGEAALESMDVESLLAMLPDDLSELMSMAESVAKLAEGMQGERSQSGNGESGNGEAGNGEAGSERPQLSEAMQKKMAALAKGLMAKLGKSGNPFGEGSQPGAMGEPQPGAGGELANAGPQPGQAGGPPGSAREGSQGVGSGTEGGGHAALRMTEETRGGASTSDMILPEPELGELPTEWVPLTVEKATPEVGKTQAAGAGREGASGTGGATWQLRLMPRHREVVRRFFAEKKKK